MNSAMEASQGRWGMVESGPSPKAGYYMDQKVGVVRPVPVIEQTPLG